MQEKKATGQKLFVAHLNLGQTQDEKNTHTHTHTTYDAGKAGSRLISGIFLALRTLHPLGWGMKTNYRDFFSLSLISVAYERSQGSKEKG